MKWKRIIKNKSKVTNIRDMEIMIHNLMKTKANYSMILSGMTSIMDRY